MWLGGEERAVLCTVAGTLSSQPVDRGRWFVESEFLDNNAAQSDDTDTLPGQAEVFP